MKEYRKTKINIYDLTKMAICVTLLCISAYILIPIPLSPAGITGLTIIVNLIGLILSPKQAGITMAVYLLLGLVGVPVFGGGTAGPGKLFGPTGGFYLGFLIAAVIISLFKGKNIDIKRYILVTIFLGMPLIYLFGSIYMSFILELGIKETLIMAVIPFILGDVIKAIAASFLGVALNNALKKIK